MGLKPAQGPTGWWPNQSSRERRATLLLTGLILALLTGLLFYQRVLMRTPLGPASPPEEEKPVGTLVQEPVTSVGAALPDSGEPTSGEPDETEVKPASSTSTPPRLSRPLPGDRRLIRSFGSIDENFGDYRLYTGSAYAASLGEPVLAAASGTIVEAERNPLYAGTVTIDHGNGLLTRYYGLGKVLVKDRDKVQGGTILGQVGSPSPAYSQMPTHLFVQVLEEGTPVDPETYIAK